jgi:hypothetical protein
VLGSVGTPGRITLVGSCGPTTAPNFHVSDDAIVFSEIVEFALSLATPSKGQESFNGFPHLQTYKFVRAASLAEMGHMSAASRWVPQPFFHKKKDSMVGLQVLRGDRCMSEPSPRVAEP